jgi:hypothetical protein
MSTFDEWLNKYWETESAEYDNGSMEDAFNAGMERAAQIVLQHHIKASFDDCLMDIGLCYAKAIRAEIEVDT